MSCLAPRCWTVKGDCRKMEYESGVQGNRKLLNNSGFSSRRNLEVLKKGEDMSKSMLAFVLSMLTLGVIAPQSAFGQTPVFTMGAQSGNGPIIVDQQTGAITFCAVNPYVNNSFGHCALIGRITASPPASLSIATAPYGAAFVLNNVTGDIMQCQTISNGGNPSGSCTHVGPASR